MLQASLDEMKTRWEAEKEKVSREAVVAYMESEAFNDETRSSSSVVLRPCAVRLYGLILISIFPCLEPCGVGLCGARANEGGRRDLMKTVFSFNFLYGPGVISSSFLILLTITLMNFSFD